MATSGALVRLSSSAPEPGAHNIPWQAVARAISTSDITEISNVKMPYLEDVTVGEFIDRLAKGSPASQREALDAWMSAATIEFDKTAAMIHLISAGK